MYSYSVIFGKLNNIRIRSFLGNRIIFVFVSRGHKLHQYCKTLLRIQLISITLTNQTVFFSVQKKNSVNRIIPKTCFVWTVLSYKSTSPLQFPLYWKRCCLLLKIIFPALKSLLPLVKVLREAVIYVLADFFR